MSDLGYVKVSSIKKKTIRQVSLFSKTNSILPPTTNSKIPSLKTPCSRMESLEKRSTTEHSTILVQGLLKGDTRFELNNILRGCCKTISDYVGIPNLLIVLGKLYNHGFAYFNWSKV